MSGFSFESSTSPFSSATGFPVLFSSSSNTSSSSSAFSNQISNPALSGPFCFGSSSSSAPLFATTPFSGSSSAPLFEAAPSFGTSGLPLFGGVSSTTTSSAPLFGTSASTGSPGSTFLVASAFASGFSSPLFGTGLTLFGSHPLGTSFSGMLPSISTSNLFVSSSLSASTTFQNSPFSSSSLDLSWSSPFATSTSSGFAYSVSSQSKTTGLTTTSSSITSASTSWSSFSFGTPGLSASHSSFWFRISNAASMGESTAPSTTCTKSTSLSFFTSAAPLFSMVTSTSASTPAGNNRTQTSFSSPAISLSSSADTTLRIAASSASSVASSSVSSSLTSFGITSTTSSSSEISSLSFPTKTLSSASSLQDTASFDHTRNLNLSESFSRLGGRKMASDSIHPIFSCDDILNEILIRLPEKCVFKFILVSKRWLYFIRNLSFRRCYEKKWGTHSHLFGFFWCNNLYINYGVMRPRSEPALTLLSTGKDGDDLLSSGILRKLGYFIDYSDGLLLCAMHPKIYHVWDSATKSHWQLPHPQMRYKSLCTAFMTEDPGEGGGDTVYKIVRANCECKVDVVNTICIETFSSLTWTWKQSTLVCSSDITLRPWTVGTVINGVIHWFGSDQSLAIYDQGFGERRISSIQLPVGQLTSDYEDSILGETSDGLLHYGQSGKLGLETWALYKEQDDSSPFTMKTHFDYQWKLRCRLSYKDMWKQNPNSGIISDEPKLLSFTRRNSESVFIRLGSNIYQCNMRSKTVEVIPYHCDVSIPWGLSNVVPYYQKIWPDSPSPYPHKHF